MIESTVRAALALTCVLCLTSSDALAQSGTGVIEGRVADPSGGWINSAAVTVVHVDTGFTRRLITDAGGRFAAPALPTGRYQVTAVRNGFAAGRQDDIVLQPGQELFVEIRLRLALSSETITLGPFPSLIDSGRTDSS